MRYRALAFALFVVSSLGSCGKASEELRMAIERYDEEKTESSLEAVIRVSMAEMNGPVSVEYAKLYYDLDPESVEHQCMYAAALGVYAGSTKNRNEQIEYGQRSLDMLNDAVLSESGNYLPYLYRGISGVRSPKFLKRYKKSISDFERVLELAAEGSIPKDKEATLLPLAYEGYIKALELNDQKAEADQARNDYYARFPSKKK